MRKYKITAYVGMDTHSKIVEAKNSFEAGQMALNWGNSLSGYGRNHYFRGTKVSAIKNSNKKQFVFK